MNTNGRSLPDRHERGRNSHAGVHVEVLDRHRDLQPCGRPARNAGEPRRPATRRPLGSHRRRQQLARRHPRRRARRRRASFPVPLRYVFEREQGRSPALNCGIRAAAGDDHRHDRRRRARAGGLAEPRGAGLERLQCDYVGGRVLPIWGGSAPDVAARPRRQALGGHRAARLRAGADRVRYARAARRQHGVPARGVRARRPVRPAHRQTRRHAARAGGPRMVHPRHARPGCAASTSRSCGFDTSFRPTG